MTATILRDPRGRAIGYLDESQETVRDENAKPIMARAARSDGHVRRLADSAAHWMVEQPRRDTGERTVLMDLAPGDVSTPATQAEYGIVDGEFIADIVSRPRMVTHQSGVWYPENAADAITTPDPNIAGDANFAEIAPAWSPVTFNTVTYAVGVRLPRQTKANADFDLERRCLRRVVQALRLMRERRVAALLTTSANWNAGNVVAATAKWNGGTGANPLLDMMNALQQSYLPANRMVLAENASQYFYVQPQASTGIRDYVQAGGEMPARLYARGKQMSAGAPVYVWAPTTPTNVALVRVTDDEDTIPSSTTFRWIGQGPDGEVKDGMLVRTFFDARQDCHFVVVVHSDAEVIVSNKVGALITGALA